MANYRIEIDADKHGREFLRVIGEFTETERARVEKGWNIAFLVGKIEQEHVWGISLDGKSMSSHVCAVKGIQALNALLYSGWFEAVSRSEGMVSTQRLPLTAKMMEVLTGQLSYLSRQVANIEERVPVPEERVSTY